MAGTLVVDTLKSGSTGPATFQNTSGTEVGRLCRAWVQFSGGTGGATINGSFNVSSISRSSAGNYSVNFTNAMPSANYGVTAISGTTTGDTSTLRGVMLNGSPNAAYVNLAFENGLNTSLYDPATASIAVFI